MLSSSLERQDSDPETDSDSDSVRCLSNWLGCSVQRGEHWRLLVPAGENNAHQLPGTSGCRFSNEGLFEGLSWNLSPAATGQLHSSSIHQQSRGDRVVSPHLPCEVSVVVGPGKGHCDHSPAHTRSVQHSGSLRVETGERSIRLDAGTRSVPDNQPNI